jgi:transcriptional regulator with GAF, ATPase, and Fis domain
MARLNLKNIIAKDGIASILISFAGESGNDILIKDVAGKLLFGGEDYESNFEYPLIIDAEPIGVVKGNEKAKEVASLLQYLLQKESEKKKLGAEVLNLYKEINLIFNFSEKLASTIDAKSICEITLSEARTVINSNHGAVILWDERENKLSVVASSGDLFFEEEKINHERQFLYNILLNGKSEIITDTTSLASAQIISSQVTSLIFSALKVNDRIMGAIIFACNEATPYTAAHLKLLTTLALQASAFIKSRKCFLFFIYFFFCVTAETFMYL